MRAESYRRRLPKELETGLDPPRIAKLLSESRRQCFQRSGLPNTGSALSQSCAELNSVQKQLQNVLREVAHPDIGVVARTRSANDSLLRSMATRAQQREDFIVRLEKQIWATWLASCCECRISAGIYLGLMVCERKTSAMRDYKRNPGATGADGRGSSRAQNEALNVVLSNLKY
jgi:hypothetical protein